MKSEIEASVELKIVSPQKDRIRPAGRGFSMPIIRRTKRKVTFWTTFPDRSGETPHTDRRHLSNTDFYFATVFIIFYILCAFIPPTDILFMLIHSERFVHHFPHFIHFTKSTVNYFLSLIFP
jgi:hypothetical protein